MAMDTRSKRSSALLLRLPFKRSLPLADGTIDQADRQATARGYAGILAAAPIITREAGIIARAILYEPEVQVLELVPTPRALEYEPEARTMMGSDS
jgi:hypothetical protein